MTSPIQSIIDQHTQLADALDAPRLKIEAMYLRLQAKLAAAAPVITLNTVGVN